MTEPMEKRYPTQYGTIHYWVTCVDPAKPWMVLLPGLTADHHLFDQQVEGLNKTYNCLTWDAPAHGRSRPFQLTFSLEDLARYLHSILETEGIRSPVLVGQSLGGYISQVYLALFPDGASGFLSIDSGPLKRDYYASWELAWLKRTKWMYRSIPWKLLVKWGAKGTAESERGRAFMTRTMGSFEKKEFCELAGYGFQLLAETVEQNGEWELPCPVLLLCGEKDRAGAVKRYNRSWQAREGRRLIWLAGAGHNANMDAPEQVNGIIDAFVRSLNEKHGKV